MIWLYRRFIYRRVAFGYSYKSAVLHDIGGEELLNIPYLNRSAIPAILQHRLCRDEHALNGDDYWLRSLRKLAYIFPSADRGHRGAVDTGILHDKISERSVGESATDAP
jgi:hypothetical protein